MKQRMIAFALLPCLLLAACGGRAEKQQEQATILEMASGLEEDALLLTVDGREVPAWRYLYWLAYACQRIQARYQDVEAPLDWETPVSGGTLADYAKDQALADTVLYATVESWAEEYGCTASPPEGSPNAALPDMGLDAAQTAELEQVGLLYAALYDLYRTEGSPLWPETEALRTYGQEQGIMTLERILIPFGEDREAARAKAETLFSQLNAAEDQAAAFSALAAEDADPTGPQTILPGDSSLEPALLEAAQALAEGQCSGILETEEGFSILRRWTPDADVLTEQYFDHLLLTAVESAEVILQPAYKTVDPAAFFAALKQTTPSAAST